MPAGVLHAKGLTIAARERSAWVRHVNAARKRRTRVNSNMAGERVCELRAGRANAELEKFAKSMLSVAKIA